MPEEENTFEGEFDPEDFAETLREATSDTGAKKLCMRAKRCSRGISCENAQTRNRTVEIQDLFQGKSPDLGDCSNWVARRELNTGLDIIQRPKGAGRHNTHANKRQAYTELLLRAKSGGPIPIGLDRETLIKVLEDILRKLKP